MGTLIRTIGRRFLSAVLFVGAFALVSHFVPITLHLVDPPAPIEQSEPEPEPPLYEDSLRADLESGECWQNDGKDHGWPTRMWYLATDEYGSYYAETTHEATIVAAIEGRLDKFLGFRGIDHVPAAYCDGVDLSGLSA